MTIHRKISQHGNSASITLPKTVLEALDVATGDEVAIDIVGDVVMLHTDKTALERASLVQQTASWRLETLLEKAPTSDEPLSDNESEAIQTALQRGLRR